MSIIITKIVYGGAYEDKNIQIINYDTICRTDIKDARQRQSFNVQSDDVTWRDNETNRGVYKNSSGWSDYR